MKMEYSPKGVCSSKIELDIEDGIIVGVNFQGGCNGNLNGISSIVIGMDARDVAKKFEGIKCGSKQSSCPAELAKAINSCLR